MSILAIGQCVSETFRNVFRNLPRVECAFELIRGDEDAHSYIFNAYPILSFRAESLRGEGISHHSKNNKRCLDFARHDKEETRSRLQFLLQDFAYQLRISFPF